ncbi:OmpA family protein (plasmid) [Ruegeria conchae]|uniref:OmpA family protein n=1 Tax=Ruegeria conchae TaxID=981384 RepID=UPI0021A33B59|nr:OmpA family protein [Ruegeria conchae]UWR05508.1 OmpA family protein [Ruegeria conchae]
MLRSTLMRVLIAFALLVLSNAASAQSADPFEHGWTLDAETSELQFLSVKKNSVAENSGFATLTGVINPDGAAEIRVLMDSVDTNIDLRNVRMRFLFFETFNYPEAVITAQLPPEKLVDLHQARHKIIDLPYTLSLHGVTKDGVAQVAITLVDNDRVAVANTTPIAIALPDFDLEEGRSKLQEAAGVDILPFGFVSFGFVFDRAQAGTPPQLVAASTTPGAAALETKGNLDREACEGRMEILSRTGNIYFNSGSARLSDASIPLLTNLHNIVDRCPELTIEIGGHTDSDGSDSANRVLSERRAQAVNTYLVNQGIAPERLVTVGYGESRPVTSNDTAEGKRRNRRIEFVPVN